MSYIIEFVGVMALCLVAVVVGVLLAVLLIAVVFGLYGSVFGAIAAGAVWAFKAITAALGV